MALGFALFAGTSTEIILASAREAEQLGYSSFWVNHPGATDGLAVLAHAAAETKRIALGMPAQPAWFVAAVPRALHLELKQCARTENPINFATIRCDNLGTRDMLKHDKGETEVVRRVLQG